MSADFDIAAPAYDQTFTQTVIGKLQRDRVWKFLSDRFRERPSMQVLELNCGTGEDALFWAQAGHHVLATDISKEMLAVSALKINQTSFIDRVQFQPLDMTELNQHTFDHKFDVVFSNFGGLNCLSPAQLRHLLGNLPGILNPGGIFIGVIMPKFSVLESVYFLAKIKWGDIFRRNTQGSVEANVDEKKVKTWYFSPDEVISILKKDFTRITIRPTGFLPSFLEPLLSRSSGIKKVALMTDHLLIKTNWSRASDHFLVAAELKQEGE